MLLPRRGPERSLRNHLGVICAYDPDLICTSRLWSGVEPEAEGPVSSAIPCGLGYRIREALMTMLATFRATLWC